jgi:bifunctional non-homologous end joining protein LigD
VIIWDKGTWIPLEDPHKGWRDGKLKFELRGHKMHGHWTLVRMKGRGNGREDPWLLIKERDELRASPPNSAWSTRCPTACSHWKTGPRRSPRQAPPRPNLPPSRRGSGPPDGSARLLPDDAAARTRGAGRRSPPADPNDWIFEIKFDGYRMLARVEGGKVRLVTRNGNDWTSRLPRW